MQFTCIADVEGMLNELSRLPADLDIHGVYKTLWTPSSSWVEPLFAFKETQFVGVWILQGVKIIPQGWWQVLTPTFLWVVSSWLDVLWVGDHSWHTQGKLLSVKDPAALRFLTHLNRCAWHLLPYPVQRHLNIFLHIPPLNNSHTQSLSQLSQG